MPVVDLQITTPFTLNANFLRSAEHEKFPDEIPSAFPFVLWYLDRAIAEPAATEIEP